LLARLMAVLVMVWRLRLREDTWFAMERGLFSFAAEFCQGKGDAGGGWCGCSADAPLQV
jgi:hypothetical protein